MPMVSQSNRYLRFLFFFPPPAGALGAVVCSCEPDVAGVEPDLGDSSWVWGAGVGEVRWVDGSISVMDSVVANAPNVDVESAECIAVARMALNRSAVFWCFLCDLWLTSTVEVAGSVALVNPSITEAAEDAGLAATSISRFLCPSSEEESVIGQMKPVRGV